MRRQALFHLGTALTAARGVLGKFAGVSQSTLSATTRLIPVLVGGNGLEFTPNSVTAQPGDVIQFQFAASNHTATQSDAAAPCQPAASGQGVNSGFIPFDGGASGMVGTFDVPVTSTEPMFLYCAQAKHCQSGMVMVINGDSNSLISYANTAAAASANTPGDKVQGGVAAQIPLANAIVPITGGGTAAAPPAPPPAPPAPAPPPPPPQSSASRATGGGGGGGGGGHPKSTLTTMTFTHGGGGVATATAFVTVGVGGGTATHFATATVVGPSGAAKPTGAAASGNGQGGLAAADGAAQPQPATFMGGATSMRGKIMDVLVVAGAMSLGTVLVTARW